MQRRAILGSFSRREALAEGVSWPQQKPRPKGGLILKLLYLCCVFAVCSLSVLSQLARNSVQEPKNNIDLPRADETLDDERSSTTYTHSSLISGSGGASVITSTNTRIMPNLIEKVTSKDRHVEESSKLLSCLIEFKDPSVSICNYLPYGRLNFGDELGPAVVDRILERYFSQSCRVATAKHHLTLEDSSRTQGKRCFFAVGSVFHYTQPGDIIWGIGMKMEPKNKGDLSSQFVDLDIYAVRGPKTSAALPAKSYFLPCSLSCCSINLIQMTQKWNCWSSVLYIMPKMMDESSHIFQIKTITIATKFCSLIHYNPGKIFSKSFKLVNG